jgi:hypothetical protein
MPDYSKSKIYKLQCDDGYYYIGSSVNELRFRFATHKRDSKTNSSRVYQHINTIGWDRVRIVLVEEYSCENKQQLIRKEDEHIRLHKDDTFCLNSYCAFRTPEQNTEHITEYQKQYYEVKREQIAKERKQHYEVNKEHILEYKKQQYQNKKLALTTNELNTEQGRDDKGSQKERVSSSEWLTI